MTPSAPEPREARGQALLIILLVMAIVLTIALSIVSRSVTDITISQKEEEAARALSAAETGIEQALVGGAISGSLPSGASFNATVVGLSSSNKDIVVPLKLASGETVPVWFVAHDEDGSLSCSGELTCFTGTRIRFCWGEPGTSDGSATTPALEVSILYTDTPGDYSTAQIARGAYDPNATRRGSNNFTGQEGSCTIGEKSFAFSKTIHLNSDLGIPGGVTSQENGLQQARFRLLYNTDQNHSVGLSVDFGGNGSLPQQGAKIESVGESGESIRKIEFFQLFSDLPPVFDFGIFSGSGGLTK